MKGLNFFVSPFVLLLATSCIHIALCEEEILEDFLEDEAVATRDGRFFNFFNSNKRNKDEIESCGDGTRDTGICQPSIKCRSKKGKNLGAESCDNGVCCQYSAKCPKRVTEPCIIRQSGVIIKSENTAPYRRTYVFPKLKDVCQVRLDFDIFSINPPTVLSDCETEHLTIIGSKTVQSLKICGENRGQHMYLTYGSANTINATMKIQTDTSRYSIRVTYIKCNSKKRVPSHCLQQYSKAQDQVTTFNNNIKQLNNQEYTVCVERLEGMNKIEWRPCNLSSFYISKDFPGIPQTDPKNCIYDWVDFFGQSKYCGSALLNNPVVVDSIPFLLRVNFDHEELGVPGHPGLQPGVDPCSATSTAPACGGADGNEIPDGGYLCCPKPPVYEPPFCTCVFDPAIPDNFQADNFNTGFCLEYTQRP